MTIFAENTAMTDTIAPMIPIPQLVATIKAHLSKADHSAEKSRQHFVSAGLHLAELKARYKTEVKASKSHTWPEYVEERFGLRRSRADELIRIGVSGTDDEVHASQKMRDAKRRVPKIAVAAATSPASPPPGGEIAAACAINGEDIAEQQRRVSEGLMRTLDLFERANVDPSDRAAEIIEQFNRAIAEATGTGKFSIARIHRVIAPEI
jgi:hypothetical protein